MRAFVIGNGLSLREHLHRGHFELLKGEVTFAMNKIHLLYDEEEMGASTNWRPTYYCFFENNSKNDTEAFDTYVPYWINQDVKCIIGEPWHSALVKVMDHASLERLEDNVQWMRRYQCHPYNHRSDRRPESWHLPELCPYGGTMNVAIQMAFMMGYDPIHLIGCDLGYQAETEDKPGANHFHPNYYTADDWALQLRDETLIHMHEVISRSVESMGRSINYAGIGGLLDVYERVNLEDLLQ